MVKSWPVADTEIITSFIFRCEVDDCTTTYTLREGQLPFEWDHEGERDELLRQYVPPHWFVIGCAHDGAAHDYMRRRCLFSRRTVCSVQCAGRQIERIDREQCATLRD